MIVLWGVPRDPSLALVARELSALKAAHRLLDQRSVLGWTLSFSVVPRLEGWLTAGPTSIRLEEVRGVYARPYDWRVLPDLRDLPDHDPARDAMAHLDEALWSWLEVSDALVLTRASSMASNSSKLVQLHAARACGFDTPATLVTSDPERAASFINERERVIYKSISGVRSVVSTAEADDPRLQQLTSFPTQFQEYVPGRDVRVHVVGGALFACEIESDAIDYRYSNRVRLEAIDLPPDCAQRCRDVASRLELPFAGIDLRRTPRGTWTFFEANPSPAFSYYESNTGLPIARAVASMLASHARAH